MPLNTNLRFINPSYTSSCYHGKGGKDTAEHLRDMVNVSNQVCDAKLRQFAADLDRYIDNRIGEYANTVFEQQIRAIIPVLEADIKSIVRIGFDGIRDILHGEKIEQYVSNAIVETMIRELKNIKIKWLYQAQ